MCKGGRRGLIYQGVINQAPTSPPTQRAACPYRCMLCYQ